MINLPAVAALRGTTDGTYAGSAAGTSAERFRSQAISRSRKTRVAEQLALGPRTRLAQQLQFPDRQLISVHHRVQLAHHFLDCSHLGQHLDGLRRTATGRMPGGLAKAERRSEAARGHRQRTPQQGVPARAFQGDTAVASGGCALPTGKQGQRTTHRLPAQLDRRLTGKRIGDGAGMCRMSVANEGEKGAAILGELLTSWAAQDGSG